MTDDFAAPLTMLHSKRQEARILAVGIKGARNHVRNSKALLKALRAAKSPVLNKTIPDAEWQLQEHEQKLAELIGKREDTLSWIKWLDSALKATREGGDGTRRASELTS